MSGLHRKFLMVRCGDKATALKVKPGQIPSMIFYDADGDRIHEFGLAGATSPLDAANRMQAGMKEALKKYSPRKTSWASGDLSDVLEEAAEEKKLVLLAFLDDKKTSGKFIKALQHPLLAKRLDEIICVRLPYKRKSDLCKKWRVFRAPTALLVNPLEEKTAKRILAKLIGKTKVPSIRASFIRAALKFERFLKIR